MDSSAFAKASEQMVGCLFIMLAIGAIAVIAWIVYFVVLLFS